MRSDITSRRAIAALFLLATSTATALAQGPTGPVVMRSENSSVLQVWVVDPGSGLAAFYGGDILAICRDEPDGWDLLDIQEVYDPQELAQMFVLHGKDIGASLWDHAPPFNSRLCADILSRNAPMATGTANIVGTGRFPQTWGDPQVMVTYGISAQGTMRTPGGETLRVNSHWRCRGQGSETRCSEGVTVK